MSDRRRSAAALSTRAHAFSVEALIGTNKKRKLRDWEEKELGLSMENLSPNGQLEEGEDSSQCLDINPDSEPSPSSDTEGLAETTSCLFSSHSDLAPNPSDSSPPFTMDDIQVELQCSDLWKRFHEIGTEMIITKAGRRMFPAMRVKILGLDPHQQYYIAMDIVPVDNKRYRYVYHSSKWMVAGNADSPVPPRVYIHPDSLASGDTWMRQVVSFDKLKLTNNELDDQGHIILHSMHKYQPRVHVIRKDFSSDLSPTKPVPVGEGVKTFSFPETVFTTVTAYQNQQVRYCRVSLYITSGHIRRKEGTCIALVYTFCCLVPHYFMK
ncbi:TBX15 factor, partial [Polyodon spathula]|nr:TBX15 factor [Polyodon spathula]